MSPLDLSSADVSGFTPIPAGTYNAEVYEVKSTETKGGGKLPAGVPMWNVQFKVLSDMNGDETHENRRVFRQFIIAPDKIDGKKYEHKAKMDGFLLRFLLAIGYDQDEITTPGWQEDFDDMAGRPCRVTVSVDAGNEEKGYEPSNPVKAVKPASENVEAAVL